MPTADVDSFSRVGSEDLIKNGKDWISISGMPSNPEETNTRPFRLRGRGMSADMTFSHASLPLHPRVKDCRRSEVDPENRKCPLCPHKLASSA